MVYTACYTFTIIVLVFFMQETHLKRSLVHTAYKILITIIIFLDYYKDY